MVRTKEIARLSTGWALGLYPRKKLNTKAIKAYTVAPSPPHIEDPESALGPDPSNELKTTAIKARMCASSPPHIEDPESVPGPNPSKNLNIKHIKAGKCAPSVPHTEDPESACVEDDVDDICSPTKYGDSANPTVESLEGRIVKLEEHTEPVDNTDLEMATAVSPAESNEELSDHEYKPKIYPKKQRTEKDDDEHLPSISVLKGVFNICPRPKKQWSKKKQVKKKGEKENDLVGLDLSGHGGRQRKVRKNQITKSDTIRRQNCITNDSDSVRQTASLSMAEPVSPWCQPQANLPSHPIIENFLRGPQERFICKDFKSYADARTFAERHFQMGSSRNGYSAVGTAGRDPRAFIEIQKTLCVFEIDTEHRTIVRDEVTELRRRPNKAKAASGTSVPPACLAS